LHESRRNRRARLKQVLESALADGGSVIIPAFSIGRTQELLYELESIIDGAQAWQKIPVILDAPLATRFTKLYRELKPWWDAEALKRVVTGRQPLAFKQLLTVNTHAQHQSMVNRLTQTRQPAIVITGSGMCTAGRVVNYLKAMLGDARNNVVFVGYQARGTPGHGIQQHGPQNGYVDLDGERYTIKAGVHTLGGYSAHADQKGLVSFITGMHHWPKEVRLVHGDEGAKATLASKLRQAAQEKSKELQVTIPT